MQTDELSNRADRQQMREIASSAAIGAALTLFAGFYLDLEGISDSRFYNGSVGLFTWTMKVGGVLMGLGAVLLWMGVRPALAIDAVLAMGIGAIMVAVGGIWLGYRDFQGFLLLIFGAMFIRSGWGSWMAGRPVVARPAVELERELDRAGAPPPVPPVDENVRQSARERLLAGKKDETAAAAAAERSRPPAIPEAPRAEEPPPEGFLAQLGRDDSERK